MKRRLNCGLEKIFDERKNVHKIGLVPRACAQNYTMFFNDKTFLYSH